METRSRLIIRSDWDTAIRSEASVWTTYKKDGAKGIQGCLKKGVNVQMDGCHGDGEAGGFYGKLLGNGRLQLGYKGEGGEMEVLVQCPSHTFEQIHPAKKNINSIDICAKGYGVSCDSEGSLKVWQSSSGEVKHSLEGHTGEVLRCAFFPSGEVVLSAGMDMKLKIWSAEDASCAATLLGHTRSVTDMAFVERGRNIVSSSRDGTIKLWDCSQSQCLHTFRDLDGGPMNCCLVKPAWSGLQLAPPTSPGENECSTDDKVVVGGSEGGRLVGLAIQNRHQIFHYDASSPINSITFTSEHTILIATQQSSLHLLDLRNTRSAMKVVKEGRGAILSVRAVDKDCILVGSADGSCYIIDENLTLRTEMTGCDLDPVREVTCELNHVYTACRDGVVRKYPLVSS